MNNRINNYSLVILLVINETKVCRSEKDSENALTNQFFQVFQMPQKYAFFCNNQQI